MWCDLLSAQGLTKSDLEALEKKGFLDGPDPFGEMFVEKQGSPHSAQTSCGARQPLPPQDPSSERLMCMSCMGAVLVTRQDDVFAIKTGVPPSCRPPSVVGVPAPCRPPSVVGPPAPYRPPMVVNGGLGGAGGGCSCRSVASTISHSDMIRCGWLLRFVVFEDLHSHRAF